MSTNIGQMLVLSCYFTVDNEAALRNCAYSTGLYRASNGETLEIGNPGKFLDPGKTSVDECILFVVSGSFTINGLKFHNVQIDDCEG